MHRLDLLVLGGYFLVMIAVGVYCALRIKAQEDFFMGGRGFGKLLQTFAAFGAGTGSSDPVNTGRTTFTNGLSGMWSVMYWLFVTPFYWITGVWYRRMRHLTLGDWFVERYESRALGAAYAVFGLLFMMVYGSMFFSAIGKAAAPIIQATSVTLLGVELRVEYVLVPVIGVVVLIYGIAGGLKAAYFTDLIQGICIILLSVILVPFGLEALVERFGTGEESLLDGFRLMHEQVPPEYFSVVGSSGASQFPVEVIVAVVLINLIGVVVQPHFIATGGGSAKTENNARVGLVLGNFLKRFCTVGWVLTALIALALFSDYPEVVDDPEKTWGVASRELLGPGLTGLMLACLLAALMSSIDAYMVVGSGLVVRNIYAAYFNPEASEREYIRVARWTSIVVVAGAVVISLSMMDVFKQLQLTWIVPVIFAPAFWIGMYWRRATTGGAWCTVGVCALLFLVLPLLLPFVAPSLRDAPSLLTTNTWTVTKTTREAAPSHVAAREAKIRLWAENKRRAEASTDPEERRAALAKIGAQPAPLAVGGLVVDERKSGGSSVFWSDGLKPINEAGEPLTNVAPVEVSREQASPGVERIVLAYPDGVRVRGFGRLEFDLLVYRWLGLDLGTKSGAQLKALGLLPKIVLPFLVMILVSLVTRRNSRECLDRYYAKMKTPVDPDPEIDRQKLEAAYADPSQLESRKLLPGTQFEFQRPTRADIVGFLVSVAACFGIIGLAVWVASIGAPSS